MSEEITLSKIEDATCDYAAAHAILIDRVEDLARKIKPLHEKIEALKADLLPGIRRSMESDGSKKADLEKLILAAPSYFKEPRTLLFYGVKVGLRTSNGSVVIADEKKTIALIKEHFEKPMVDLLVKTEETPIKSTIRNLSAENMGKIAVQLVDVGADKPVVSVDGDEALEKELEALDKSARTKAAKKK